MSGREKVRTVKAYRIVSKVPEKRAHDWHQIPFHGSVITSSVTTVDTDYKVWYEAEVSRRRATSPKAMRSVGDNWRAKLGTKEGCVKSHGATS